MNTRLITGLLDCWISGLLDDAGAVSKFRPILPLPVSADKVKCSDTQVLGPTFGTKIDCIKDAHQNSTTASFFH